jgi:hypothetical protein
MAGSGNFNAATLGGDAQLDNWRSQMTPDERDINRFPVERDAGFAKVLSQHGGEAIANARKENGGEMLQGLKIGDLNGKSDIATSKETRPPEVDIFVFFRENPALEPPAARIHTHFRAGSLALRITTTSSFLACLK